MPKLTLAPLPAVRALSLAAVQPALSDEALSASWCRDGDRGVWLSRSAWSLSVIAVLRARVCGARPVTVWVPDYFCNASLAPLREASAKLVFYPITDSLNPDLEWCRTQSALNRPDIFVLVHYFGQPAPAGQVAEFCKVVGAWLIEDAAHVLRPIVGVGDYGDYVLYSPHKHLAIPDGAVLVVRKDGPARLGRSVRIMTTLSDVIASTRDRNGSDWFSLIWLAKRILQKLGFRGKESSVPFWSDAQPENVTLPRPRMSSVAKRLLSVQLSQIEHVAQLRKLHRQAWEESLAVERGISESFRAWPLSATPYLACFIGKDFAIAKRHYTRWQCGEMPVLTWPDLPPEVLTEPEKHSVAIRFRKTGVFLPVHQSLRAERISRIGIKFSRSIKLTL